MPGLMIERSAWTAVLGDYVAVVEVSSEGSVLAGSLAGDAVILDGSGAAVVKLAEHPLGVLSGAWSPDGSRCGIGGQDGMVRVVDGCGKVLTAVNLGDWVGAMAWSQDGTYLAAAAGRRLAIFGSDGALVHHFAPVSSTITAVAWATNGRRVGVTSYGGTTWFEPGRLPDEQPCRKHDFAGSPLSLVVAPNGKWCCAGFQDASIHLWKLWSGDDLSMSGYPAKVEHLAFRDDSHWMASACLDELTIWDFSGRGPNGTRPASGTAHEGHISAMAWEPAGSSLLTGGSDGRIVLWPSPRSIKHRHKPTVVIETEVAVSKVAWMPDGTNIVVGYADGTVECRPITSA